MDPYKYLQIVPNPDGTITRDPTRYPNSQPTAASNDPNNPVSTDTPINSSNNTWARIFLPETQPGSKLPLVVYFHGGGFINCGAASTVFHDFCSNMAVALQAVILSVDYRLAPEHRLPVAYDDAKEVLHWLPTTQHVWLREYADYSRCFLMGSSAGANIAYHVGLRVREEEESLEPLKIVGLILHHPFIGGMQRTESELRLANDSHLPQCVSDLMWELALPVGVDRDHEYCNPTTDGGSRVWKSIGLLGWSVLVTGCDGDPTVDRQRQLANMLVAKDVHVVSHFDEGGYHVVELKEPSKAKILHLILKDFMFSSLAA